MSDEVRTGATHSAGMGGGARSELKMPSPTDRRGEGACRVGGGGLLLRSRVSTSDTVLFLRADVDLRERFSDANGLLRTGEAFRDGAGVAKASIGFS